MSRTDVYKHKSPQLVSKAALQAYFQLCSHWDLTEDEMKALLGDPSCNEFKLWKDNATDIVLDELTLYRISYLLKIYKSLIILLGRDEADIKWIKRPNAAPIFAGDSALNYILGEDGIEHLKNVCLYLERELI